MTKSFLEQLGDRLRGRSPTIKIGVITSQVGPMDYYGTMQVRGLKLGIEYATQGSWQVAGRPYAIPQLIQEMAPEETTPPLIVQ